MLPKTKFTCIFVFGILWLCLVAFGNTDSYGQLVLLGDNLPFGNVCDGNFELVRGYWRQSKQSPYWKTKVIGGPAEYQMGLHNGTLFCADSIGVAESVLLNTNPHYQHPKSGDILHWSFDADLEYRSKGAISFSLVIGNHERILVNRQRLKGADKEFEHFKGTYVLTQEDAVSGFPFVRVTFYTEDQIKIFLDNVTVFVESERFAGPRLQARIIDNTIGLSWSDVRAGKNAMFRVYRQRRGKQNYEMLAETQELSFQDSSIISGVEYEYVLTRIENNEESPGSNKVSIACTDIVAPRPPEDIQAKADDCEIKVSWSRSPDRDVKCYTLYRAEGNNFRPIARGLRATTYLDFTPAKDCINRYRVVAHDYSGNTGSFSPEARARVKMMKGASFSDLILPMPVHEKLTSETWGAPGVVPRDVQNGIEDSAWSYWGGRPVQGADGRFHMNVVRWPANAQKGHWEWPRSTGAYAVSVRPDGPYRIVREHAYEFAHGLGHNADIVLMNNGRYLLYALIDWKPNLFEADSPAGPWKHLGVMKIDRNTTLEKPELFYRFERNLSGVQRADGRFLFVTKGGAMMLSEGTDPLGPYKIMTGPLQGNPIIPEKYRNSNFEDPVLWKDEVQYHMIINAFHDFRAIYLRSPDGIHWKFNPGTAYTPDNTMYENGVRTHWYKLERPHVLTDRYGRATHLSLAAIDVPKADDMAGDNHNSKNIILPLVVPKRMRLLSSPLNNSNKTTIEVLLLSENGFDAPEETDIKSLRFGSSEAVDYGRGSVVRRFDRRGKDLWLQVDVKDCDFRKDDFVGKLIGHTKTGKLLVGYVRWQAE